jgi:hypothetical protein
VLAAKEEKLITGGVSASAAATVTDEERRAARKAAYLAMIADKEDRPHAQLAAKNRRLPSLAARLRLYLLIYALKKIISLLFLQGPVRKNKELR